MEQKILALMVGAIIAAAAFVVVAQNMAFAQQSTNGKDVADQPITSALLPDNEPASGNYSAGGNFTIGPEGFGNNQTGIAQDGMHSANTTQLRLYIQEARTSLNSNDTQGALLSVMDALEEIENILSGNATNTTTTASVSNATSTGLFGNSSTINDGSNMTTFEEMAQSGEP